MESSHATLPGPALAGVVPQERSSHRHGNPSYGGRHPISHLDLVDGRGGSMASIGAVSCWSREKRRP